MEKPEIYPKNISKYLTSVNIRENFRVIKFTHSNFNILHHKFGKF